MTNESVVSAEDELIARYFKPLAKHPGAFDLADDAAAITPPAGHDLVLAAGPRLHADLQQLLGPLRPNTDAV